MDAKLVKILNALRTDDYVTAENLSHLTGMGVKTVRIKIGMLNDQLAPYGACVVSRAHYGYKLSVSDADAYEHLARGFSREPEKIPDTAPGRESYCLHRLLTCDGYLKLDDLAEELYISRTTVFFAVRNVENTLAAYDLKIERRPHYGVRLAGLERNKRRLLEALPLPAAEQTQARHRELRERLVTLIQKAGFSFSDIALARLVKQVMIAAGRVEKGFSIGEDEALSALAADDNVCRLAEELSREIGAECAGEVRYLALLVMCGRSLEAKNTGAGIPLINERVQGLVVDMLDHVYLGSGVDFRGDLELRISLSLHLISLDTRIFFGLMFAGEELAQTKEYYALAYSCATQACIPLVKYYHTRLTDYETASIALLFALSLEKEKKDIALKRILIFCASGHNSAQLLAHQYEVEFAQYIRAIETRSLSDYTQADIDRADCIFTTVPLPFAADKPVFQVSQFLLPGEIPLVREALVQDTTLEMQRYYSANLFFTGVAGENREEVITELCRRIRAVRPLPEPFERLTLEREKLAPTDYGNLIAFPHPLTTLTEDTFVCVGILEKPILWERNPVQVVLVISTSRFPASQAKLREFHAATLGLITDGAGVRKLIEKPAYQTLMALITKKGCDTTQ